MLPRSVGERLSDVFKRMSEHQLMEVGLDNLKDEVTWKTVEKVVLRAPIPWRLTIIFCLISVGYHSKLRVAIIVYQHYQFITN